MRKAVMTILPLLAGLCLYAGQGHPLPAESSIRAVYVNDGSGWRQVKAYDALCSDSPSYHGYMWNDWDNSREYRDTMSFALVQHDFESPLSVRVVSRDVFSSVSVRPTAYGIKPEMIDSHTVEFSIEDYSRRKVSVEFDGDRYSNLFLFCDRPDAVKPPEADSKVHYFGPGEHNPGKIVLKSGETLYIDSGALVYGRVSVEGDNCRIAGQGILAGSQLPHWGTQWACGDILLECNPARKPARKSLTVEDITIVDSPNWTLSVFNYSDVHIDNINMINWILNGDGIDLVCVDGAEIKDCFIRCYDDCISLKVRHNANPMSDLRNIRVSGCTIWSDFARGIVIGPEAGNSSVSSGTISDCAVEDCVFLEHATIAERDDVRGAFAIHQVKSPDWKSGVPPVMSGISARNLTFDNMNPSGRAIVIAQDESSEGAGLIDGVEIDGVEIIDSGEAGISALEVNSNHNEMRNIVLKNINRTGRPIIPRNWKSEVSGNDVDIESPASDVRIRGNVDIKIKR